MAVFVIIRWRITLMSNAIPIGSVAMANNAYNANQQAFAAQAHNNLMQNLYNQQISGLGKVRQPKPFKIQGKEMELQEFVETLYPEDCPERSYLLLKLTKGNEDD
jgi:hypothetical protein